MQDRAARADLIDAICAYLDDRMMAFEFSERIDEIASDSEDQTVHFVVDELWGFYDDCKDHHVVLAKKEWDYIQRLILVLDSESEVHISRARCWSPDNGVAMAALALFGVLLWGFQLSYWFIAAPFGALSMYLSDVRRRRRYDSRSSAEIALIPFASLGEIRGALARNPAFRKQRYPANLILRRIRGPVEATLGAIRLRILWLVASPVVLLFQTLPDYRTQPHVKAV